MLFVLQKENEGDIEELLKASFQMEQKVGKTLFG